MLLDPTPNGKVDVAGFEPGLIDDLVLGSPRLHS